MRYCQSPPFLFFSIRLLSTSLTRDSTQFESQSWFQTNFLSNGKKSVKVWLSPTHHASRREGKSKPDAAISDRPTTKSDSKRNQTRFFFDIPKNKHPYTIYPRQTSAGYIEFLAEKVPVRSSQEEKHQIKIYGLCIYFSLRYCCCVVFSKRRLP